MKQAQEIVLSGIQPSGELHVGNYLGMVKNAVALQDHYNCYYMVADLHSLTESFDPAQKKKDIFELMVDLLAIGIDPKKSVLFVQSSVNAHTELAWILSCIAPMGELERMTQYKDKSAKDPKNINVGLFTYPVLQAADVLAYKAAAVPVGSDQLQHLELVRVLGRKFNNRFGETFPEVKPLVTSVPKVMSLVDPTKKMSKSAGRSHYIALSDEPDVIHEKIKHAVTDSGANGEMSAGVANLFMLLGAFGDHSLYARYQSAFKDGSIRYSELKDDVARAIADYFAPFRKRRAELYKNPKKVNTIYAKGSKQAEKIASQTLSEVKEKIGLL